MAVKTRGLPWFWVERLLFANDPAGPNRIHQRYDVLLVDGTVSLEDPDPKAIVALVGQDQHEPGYVHHGIGEGDQSVAVSLATHPHGIGGAVLPHQRPGEIAILVFWIGEQMPHGE